MKVIHVAGLGWLPAIALALWWAGFAPFPQAPAEVGEEAESFDGVSHADAYGDAFLVSLKRAHTEAARAPYGANSWYCHDDDGTPNAHASTCTIWLINERPKFGFGEPRWMLVVEQWQPSHAPRSTVIALYRSYAACMWVASRKQGSDAASWKPGDPTPAGWDCWRYLP